LSATTELSPDGIIGTSDAMVRLRAFVAKLARSDTSVLITGETGTGKERVAECLHRASARAHRPMVAINCAAVPDSLLESELFGYERGAFTGAHAAYPGKLRLAGGGTVFLDEIGDMTPYGQAKLLRVLECREIFPLGGSRLVPVDVRFVTATNQDLEMQVAHGKFRKDLYYRLNVAQVALPPLRERKEDIPALLAYYVDDLNRRHHGCVGDVAPELLDCLLAYEWPGNVRELKNLLEAVFIDPPAGDLGLGDLPDSFQRILSRYVVRKLGEREKLVSILQATNWNKSKAAAELKWSRMTLYRKLSKYRIPATRS
jgi:transcriptional regulator with PAS, ATPase and Fis domain